MISRAPDGHKRSVSSGPMSHSPGRAVSKAKSTSALADAAAAASAPMAPPSSFQGLPESDFSTLKDPRVASSSDLSQTSSPSHHPDLSSEVAALSVKLIQAINNQTTLDDTLAATRQELEKAQNKIIQLETENKKFRDDIANEVLVRKTDVDCEVLSLKAALAEERAQRALVERGKKRIEQELENLTAALFEEANKMVAAAKHEREAVEKKNEQLRSQIRDAETLLASHQEQLAELKAVMQEMNAPRDEIDTHANTSTAPSSPRVVHQPRRNVSRPLETTNLSPVTPGSGDVSPGPPTSFSHLIKTVCRTDIQAYDEFHDLLVLSRSSKPPSRAASGSYASFNVMGLGSLTGHNAVSNGSTPSLSAQTPQNHSPNGSASSPQLPSSHVSLKETRFYKRALTEDIEPTLRLDTAPGISWLTRRAVLGSISEGGLVVEPMSPVSRKYAFPCSLCGERRKGTENERTHRFRTSDSETAQRYPLCMLCLEKVRSCCEFTGYLRLILDGHIRIGDVEEEREAWEETIRLRERMFWSRIGGGVVPVFTQTNGSEKEPPVSKAVPPQTKSQESLQKEEQKLSTSESVGVQTCIDELGVAEDPFLSDSKGISIGRQVPTRVETSENLVPNKVEDDSSSENPEITSSDVSRVTSIDARLGDSPQERLHSDAVSDGAFTSLSVPEAAANQLSTPEENLGGESKQKLTIPGSP
ncbi:GDP/GTP exchange factor Sec2p [Thermoascus aurantiacus ATCC 26904]